MTGDDLKYHNWEGEVAGLCPRAQSLQLALVAEFQVAARGQEGAGLQAGFPPAAVVTCPSHSRISESTPGSPPGHLDCFLRTLVCPEYHKHVHQKVE